MTQPASPRPIARQRHPLTLPFLLNNVEISQSILLLVEDDPDDRLFFARAANKAGVGAAVQMATDGQEAIDYLTGAGYYSDRKRHPLPSLIVLDLKMPLVTGFEVLEAIRKSPQTSYLPVVVMTSSQSEVDIAKAYALGANAYLVKPSNPEKLINIVQSFKHFWLRQNRLPLHAIPPPTGSAA